MLAAGTAAQASFSTFTLGLPAIAPALRAEYDLGLTGIGVFLAAQWVGLTLGLLPWGLVTDRVGERRALAAGLAGCGVLVAAAALADGAVAAGALLVVAGAVGASVQSASGRAVMQWFAPAERGLAFGIRQTAVPVGGFVGALVLPALTSAGGIGWAFVFVGAFCVATAVVGGIVVRELPSEGVEPGDVPWTLRDSRLWLLSGGSSMYVATQGALFAFLVLFLHDEHGLSNASAAAIFAVSHVFAMGFRIGVGRWSDVIGSRFVPLRQIGLAMFVSLGVATVLLDAPTPLVAALLVAATALASAWNGLAFVAAAELSGTRRSGAAIGFQQTALSFTAVVTPPLFAAIVAASSWRAAFAVFAFLPLAGWVLLGRASTS